MFVILAVIAAAIYGIGRLLTSNVTSAVGVDYHAGKIQSSNNSSFSHSHSSSDHSIFQARRIAIGRADDHPVLDQAVTRLSEDLLALGFVDEVDVFGPDETHEPDGLLYDAYLTLSIDVKQDDKLFLERDFKASVHVTAGTMPYNSRSSYHDHLSMPGINYALNGQIEHTSVSTQVGTPYKMIADNIGEELAGKITEQFAEWHEEFGADVDWPDDLIGSYPRDLTIPWPDGIKMDSVVDGCGLMQHRHALWSTETDRPEMLVQAFHQTYTDAGWRIDSGAVIGPNEHHERYHFRAWNDSPHQVEVFEVRDGYGEREPGEVTRVCVRYQHRFDRDETRRVISKLIEDDNLTVLRYLKRQMDREQRDRYYQMLEASRPTDPHDNLALAEFHHNRENDERAKRFLSRASLFAYRTHDKPAFENKIKESAKKMGYDSRVLDPALSPELAVEIGYRSLDNIIGETSTIGLTQAVQFYYTAQGSVHTHDLWLDIDPENSDSIRMYHYEREGGGVTGWGSGLGIRNSDPLYWGWSVDSDQGTYIIHFRQQPDNQHLFDVTVTSEADAGVRLH